MSTAYKTPVEAQVHTVFSLLDEYLDPYRPRSFAIRLWDGTTWGPTSGQPARFTFVLKHPGALWRMFWKTSELNLAEAYINNDFDIEGNIEAVLPVAEYLMNQRHRWRDRLRLGWQLFSLNHRSHRDNGQHQTALHGHVHTVERDRQAVTHHYDVSNDFYALWLDPRLIYSCAYFASPQQDIEAAQADKLDIICHKLRLRPGEKLLDIGCGWGGLILHAAQHYGVEALGITLSRPQAELANQRIAAAGLSARCRAEVCDYRQLKAIATYDKAVSVGMVEHVGHTHLPAYFRQVWKVLKPGGVFLNHGIGNTAYTPANTDTGFIGSYVFPDGELPPIHTILKTAEDELFEVRDVESWREHYVLTLRHWVRRLEQRRQEARKLVSEKTYRIWRLYMAGCAYWFDRGRINVYQTLLVKPKNGKSALPLRRDDWYNGSTAQTPISEAYLW